MVKLLTKNLWRKLRGMSAFTNVTVGISKTKTKRLTVGKKSARNLIDLVSVWIFFESKTDVSFGFEADIVVALGLKKRNKFACSQHNACVHLTFRWTKCMALRSFAIVCDYMETALFAIVCDHMKTSLKTKFCRAEGFPYILASCAPRACLRRAE